MSRSAFIPPLPPCLGWHRGELRAWCAAQGLTLIALGSVAWVGGMWQLGLSQHRVTVIQPIRSP